MKKRYNLQGNQKMLSTNLLINHDFTQQSIYLDFYLNILLTAIILETTYLGALEGNSKEKTCQLSLISIIYFNDKINLLKKVAFPYFMNAIIHTLPSKS